MGRSSYSSSSSTSQKVTTAILGVGLLLAAAVLVVTLGPFKLNKQQFLTIGVLYDRNDDIDKRFIDATNEAVKDIFKLVEEQGFLSKPVPGIYLKFRKSTETTDEAIERLQHDGVKVFLGYSVYDNPKPSVNMTDETNILSTSHIPHNLTNKIHQISPSQTLLANSFLHLINSTSPNPNNPINVLPVMRDDTKASELYSKLVTAVKMYPSITMMSPVVYTPTQYPRSDAFEVVSSIGSYIAVKPDAEVLILSSEDLADILGVTHVNPTLQKRRWFAVGAASYEEDIQASSRGRRMATQVSLTTLSFLGVGDPSSQEAKIRGKYLIDAFDKEKVKGTVYEEFQAYEAVIKLHRAFAYSELSSARNLTISIQTVFGLDKGSGQEQGLFASMFLMPNKVEEVEFIPKMNWLVEAVVNATVVDKGLKVTYEEVRTSPLTRKEVEDIYELKKPTCPKPTFTVDIMEKTFFPRTSLNYSLDTFPKAVILPVAGGVAVGVHCGLDVFRFSCVQSKYDSGDLACLATKEGVGSKNIETPEHPEHPKQKRATEGTNMKDKDEKETKLNATLGELEIIEAEFGGIIGSWQNLVPKVVGCYASVSGCDFCYYFLAVYNLSVTPAVCNGGCALGVLGSCSALLTDSFSSTLL